MKKKILFIISFILVLGIGIFMGTKFSKSNLYEEEDYVPEVTHKNMLSMMLEQNVGVGDYSLETRNSWPTKEDGYVFNPTLSKCEKGSKLRWDDENNVVVMVGTTSDKCYAYFDVYKKINLAEYVKSQYTSIQGENSIYYHDSSLENGAGDNSYRYAGASDDVNNYVCFGSDAATCPDDNLYRIIGVFGNQVKLIKWDYATSALLGTDGDYSSTCSLEITCSGDNYGTSRGTNSTDQIGVYWWNNDGTDYGTNTWSASKLNAINLNKNFLKNIGTVWSNKIAKTTWQVGGTSYNTMVNVTIPNVYVNEIITPTTNITYDAKIALMYLSDYGYAASPSAWSDTINTYNNLKNSYNWMGMGLFEWTVTRVTDEYYGTSAFGIGFLMSGIVIPHVGTRAMTIRPVFYLNSDVEYSSGTGTKNDPIRIKID